jgi:hypothetical protein
MLEDALELEAHDASIAMAAAKCFTADALLQRVLSFWTADRARGG